ncbi:MAG: type II toxin-antitoxin system VapC family toxin [Candidatus Dormibacteraeota bacterium]|nr:type II toxin-antitoxin system VapC family toxin [Candidatus Dormibacteraeota bacterium]
MRVVFDTSVLIDILRNDSAALEYARGVREVPTCSEVTRVEIVRGLRSAERASAEQLFQAVRWVAVDEPIARQAGELGRRWDRHRPGISLADLVVAATTEQLEAYLATTNVRHFPMFEGLRPPYYGR